ncbi:hypothetical protein [Pseudomonas sp. CAM1A]|uniref:hypothetical protein n=1 Tax=Pseudomonas sp. CAM1A TaxID=3231717 RepID=UPI0039C6EFE9
MDVRLFAFLACQRSAKVQPREQFCGLPKRGLALLLELSGWIRSRRLSWPAWCFRVQGLCVGWRGVEEGLLSL